MITNGIWEIDIYPHCPYKYRPKDIVFTYFIEFDRNLLQCEVVNVDEKSFTFIHRKTTPLKDEDNDLIFSPKYDARPNWRRKITKPILKVEKKIAEYYKADKIFYQDNEVGEIVRNYLQWCGK
jgi:glutaredoxin 2